MLGFDDTFYAKDSEGNKIWIHNIKDLASQYLLPPIAGKFLNGKEVAANLEKLFITHGAPLYLKADNGPNLNSIEVQQLLKRFQVIIVNSPEYYSKYNGSIEQANGLIKKEVDDLAQQMKLIVDINNILPLARLAAHELNSRWKRSIKDRPTCLFWNYHDQNKKLYTNKKGGLSRNNQSGSTEAGTTPEEKRMMKHCIKKCKRKAAEEILKKRGYIKIHEPECYPILGLNH